jgi:hypothetical protein
MAVSLGEVGSARRSEDMQNSETRFACRMTCVRNFRNPFKLRNSNPDNGIFYSRFNFSYVLCINIYYNASTPPL